MNLYKNQFYDHQRHSFFISFEQPCSAILESDWRMRDRLKTVSVALLLCLNIGIDPPDAVKTIPCGIKLFFFLAKTECWVDPFTLPPR